MKKTRADSLRVASENCVYKLQKICDDPRFEGFGIGGFPETFPRLPLRQSAHWKMFRFAKKWKPLKATGRVRPFNDYPCANLSHPVFSLRAVDALRDFLEPNGELLPLDTKLGAYYFFNVTTLADAVDWSHTNLLPAEPRPMVNYLGNLKFTAQRLAGLSIFGLRESPGRVFVTGTFVQRVREHGLNGFDFIKLWPLPPGADYQELHKKESQKRARIGLPAGQTLKGNTFVVHLKLADPESKGSEAELARIEQLENELDALLASASSAPVIGSLEGHDVKDGECRLVLSCPDAALLEKKLKPWLKKLKWDDEVRVVRHDQEFYGLVDF